VILLLQEMGCHVAAVQNPTTSLADEVALTKKIIALQDGPVILVGHSWGGGAIAQEDIAQRLPIAERKLPLAVQGQSYEAMFDEKLTVAAWKAKSCWAVIPANGRMLPAAIEEAAARKKGGRAVDGPPRLTWFHRSRRIHCSFSA
jgi:hypothetical protein